MTEKKTPNDGYEKRQTQIKAMLDRFSVIELPHFLTQYPMASGYILGLYSGTLPFLTKLENTPKAKVLMKRLNAEIRNHHPKWTRDEVFYRGAETYDAFIEACMFLPADLSEEEQHEVVREIVSKTKQHYSLVLLSHAIGNLVNEKNPQIEDH